MKLQISYQDGTSKEFLLDSNGVATNNSSGLIDVNLVQGSRYHVLVNNKSIEVELVEWENGDSLKLKLKAHNRLTSLSVKTETDLLLEKMGLDIKKSKSISDLKAPMPGLIVNLHVEEGQRLKPGDPVLVLEAMKMENLLKATDELVVSKVHVTKGQKVEKNTILVSFA